MTVDITITEPIRTERLLLRPCRLDDAEALYDLMSRPDVVRYLYWNVATLREVEALMEQRASFTRLRDEGDRLVLAVERLNDPSPRMIGEMTLFLRSMKHQQGELGYVFHPDVAGRGYATEASRAILNLAFRDAGMHRVTARADARNTASEGVMKRLGMRQEAHFVQNEFVKGEWTDEIVYALLNEEWSNITAQSV